MNHSKDIIIIGAGPAGLACAIQLKRYGLDPLLIEKDEPGGLLRNAGLIENYLGFPDGISGMALIDLFKKQIEKYNVTPLYNKVISVDLSGDQFLIQTSTGQYACNFLVVASGTSPVPFTDITLPADAGGNIGYEIRDFRHLKQQQIGIIGSGDAAFDYALQLAENDNQISIYYRSKNIKSIKVLADRVIQHNNISLYADHLLTDVSKSPFSDGIQLLFKHSNKTIEYQEDYLIFATGRKPAVEFLSAKPEEEKEFLIRKNRLFFAGDVKNDLFRQVSIATGDGIRTAMAIIREKRRLAG